MGGRDRGILKETLHQRETERFEREERLRQDRSRYLSLKELQENFEGYEKGVKSLLLRKKEDPKKWEGILGAVADILEPEPRYEAPLEGVLGERLQYLMVESEKEGLEAIGFLKRESLGRGSFIPRGVCGKEGLDQLLEPADPAAEEKGKPFPLSRFVKVKDGFSPIAEYLIGGVGVVECWEDAQRGMERNGDFETLVTLEGDVLQRSGVMSGGGRDQGLGILERKREIRELEGKTEEEERWCQRAREEDERLQREVSEREGQLETRKKEIQDKEIELLHRDKDLEQTGRGDLPVSSEDRSSSV